MLDARGLEQDFIPKSRGSGAPAPNEKTGARPVCAGQAGKAYFFLTMPAALTWLTAHLPAKACMSFRRLSRSVPMAVTV